MKHITIARNAKFVKDLRDVLQISGTLRKFVGAEPHKKRSKRKSPDRAIFYMIPNCLTTASGGA